MFIRTAGERDLEAVRALLVETWHATYDGIYGAEGVAAISDRWHSVAWLRQSMRRPRSEFIVADTGSQLAGMAYAAILANDAGVVELQEMNVRPAMQGAGVGGLLLDEVQSSFFECRLIRLEVEEKNRRAVRFYEAAGFSRTGSKKATQWVDATLATMEKRLS
ncbi:MAG: GNAT family N-acetyltransferase [Mesorhizobium sp.]|nr:GNAT family N-acetyltransferase [Mesorhizobium sp.]MBN9244528.1 GNAT family N-acetyltransferase [Mesorhizobium sp.]